MARLNPAYTPAARRIAEIFPKVAKVKGNAFDKSNAVMGGEICLMITAGGTVDENRRAEVYARAFTIRANAPHSGNPYVWETFAAGIIEFSKFNQLQDGEALVQRAAEAARTKIAA